MTGGQRLSGHSVVAPPPAFDVLYGAKGGPNTATDLYTIDPSTAALTPVGATGFAITGMACRSDGVMFAVTSNNSGANPGSLITIDLVTGAGTLVGALGVTNGLADISFRDDGVLYGIGSSTYRLYTIDQSTGAATQVSGTAGPGPARGNGMTFDTNDVLYYFPKNTDGLFYVIDPATGGFTAQPDPLTGTPTLKGSVPAVACDPAGVIWAAENNPASSPTKTFLLTIDPVTATTPEVAETELNLDAIAWGPAA